jgi:hypothetical protein
LLAEEERYDEVYHESSSQHEIKWSVNCCLQREHDSSELYMVYVLGRTET